MPTPPRPRSTLHPLSDRDLDELQDLLDSVPAPLEPLDVSMLDGFLCGVLVQPQRVAENRWLPHVTDSDGKPLPPRFDAVRLHALVRRRHAELDDAIARRQWFDPWIFELEVDAADAPRPPAAGPKRRGARSASPLATHANRSPRTAREAGNAPAIRCASKRSPVDPPVKYSASICAGCKPACAAVARAAATIRAMSSSIASTAACSVKLTPSRFSTWPRSIRVSPPSATSIFACSARAASSWPRRAVTTVISRS